MASNIDGNNVQSVERAIKILETLGNKDGGVNLKNLSDEVALHKSTVHRLISTMMKFGFVQQDDVTGYYSLGLSFINLSSKVLDSMDVRKIANPFLKELHAIANEVVHLVILNNYDVVYIDKIESYQSININSSIGKVVPFHCTAVGKVLVSQKSKEDVIKALVSKGMNKYTDKSITDPDIFLKELDKVNRLGYAIDDNEYEIGIRCIAAPIKNHMGKIVAAISVAGFDSRITDERLADFVEMVAITAARISEKMGFDASIIL